MVDQSKHLPLFLAMKMGKDSPVYEGEVGTLCGPLMFVLKQGVGRYTLY